MNVEDLEIEALRLDSRARARLAHRLLRSLDSLSDEEAERLWLEEAERRNAAIEAGTSIPRPADDVLRDAKARLK